MPLDDEGLDGLASESSTDDTCAPTLQEDRDDESVSRTLILMEEKTQLEKQPASSASGDQMWFPTSCSVTADDASSHVGLLKPALRERLARVGFEGQYMIQVGFNETMLQQGTLLQEIHLFLDGNLELPEQGIYGIFAPIFAPFPTIIYTPGETFYIPIHTSSQSVSGCCLRLQTLSGSNTNTTTQDLGSSGDPAKGSEDQKEKSAKDDSRIRRKMQDGGGDGGPGDSSSDDNDEGDKGKKGNHGGRKGKRKQREPRVINIPFKARLLTTGLEGEFITRAGVDITVHHFFVTNSGLHKGSIITCHRSKKVRGLVQLIVNGTGHGLRSQRLSWMLLRLPELRSQLISCRLFKQE